MSTTAQTITIIVTVCAVTVGVSFGAVTLVTRSINQRIDDLIAALSRQFDRMDSRLDRIENVIVVDHGQRIARLEGNA